MSKLNPILPHCLICITCCNDTTSFRVPQGKSGRVGPGRCGASWTMCGAYWTMCGVCCTMCGASWTMSQARWTMCGACWTPVQHAPQMVQLAPEGSNLPHRGSNVWGKLDHLLQTFLCLIYQIYRT